MKFRITSEYGELSEIRDHVHRGIDYAMQEGTPITALKDGIITKVVDFGDVNAGKTIFLQMEDGNTAIFGHLNKFLVEEGQRVFEGQKIALSGNTGASTAPHLHFAVKENGHFINPESYNNLIQTMGDEKPGWLMQKYNAVADAIVGKEMEVAGSMFKWLGEGIATSFQWFLTSIYPHIYQSIPEMGALITIIAGVAIMLTGNIAKHLSYYGITMSGLVIWIISG